MGTRLREPTLAVTEDGKIDRIARRMMEQHGPRAAIVATEQRHQAEVVRVAVPGAISDRALYYEPS